MFKKLVVFVWCLLPLATFAQNFKFGVVSSTAIFDAMPEKATIQKDLEALNTRYESELQKLGEEYQRKVSDLVGGQDTLPETIRQRRAQEIGELEQRIQNFRQVASQDFQQQQQAKFQPVMEKIAKAIQEVGQENNFTYILDLDNMTVLYFSPTTTEDVLPLVKAKMGLK